CRALPTGPALSWASSGPLPQPRGWRRPFPTPAAPGLLLGFAALMLPEPVRASATGAQTPGHLPALRAIAATPAMYWIALSGAIHNFNLYAISTFLSPLLIRYHGVDIARAGQVSGLVYGVCGGLGMLTGGWLACCLAA